MTVNSMGLVQRKWRRESVLPDLTGDSKAYGRVAGLARDARACGTRLPTCLRWWAPALRPGSGAIALRRSRSPPYNSGSIRAAADEVAVAVGAPLFRLFVLAPLADLPVLIDMGGLPSLLRREPPQRDRKRKQRRAGKPGHDVERGETRTGRIREAAP